MNTWFLSNTYPLQLGVDDEKFWHDVEPLEFGNVPQLEEDVVCVGFPTGGDNISVTRGVVSRVEIQRYAHSAVELLAIQVRIDLPEALLTVLLYGIFHL